MTGSSKAYDGRAIATLMVLLMTLSILPIINVSAEDYGDPSHLQAQDIQASFDKATELTTITWRNMDTLEQPSALDNFFNSVYIVYRHTEPITQQNLVNAIIIHTVDACDDSQFFSKYECLGGTNGSHLGHSFSYQVVAGTNESAFYGITTSINVQNVVTEYGSLIVDESSTSVGVKEETTPIRTPFNLQAVYDIQSSSTTLSWINYNDILFSVLPETGDDAYISRIWQTNVPLTRQNAQTILISETPIAEITAGISSHSIDIPPTTDRSVYYSITYLLPNYSGVGLDYEDIRFLSNNAMSQPVNEDNMPPDSISGVTASFAANPETGDGFTTISWDDSLVESGESYAIYSSGEAFNNTTLFGVELLNTVSEGIGTFDYQVPVGRLGTSYYCVVVIDDNGIFATDIPQSACSSEYEDAFYNWIAEPTNVVATFLGNKQTQITWQDQLGAEGEMYNIWRSSGILVLGSQFVENVTIDYLGTVTDGVESFVVDIAPEQDSASYYYVTSVALYQHSAGPYHYTELQQNWFGPVYEDTVTPAAPRVNGIEVEGELAEITIEWLNDAQLAGETYSIWKHNGTPFGESENQVSVVNEENGWVMFDSEIVDTGSSFTEFKFVKNYDIPNDVENEVWYAIVVEDAFGNSNLEANPGTGGNALKVKEDTVPPTAEFNLYDSVGDLYESPSLVSGSYTLRVQVNENLITRPTVSITTSSGGDITNGQSQMLLFADNLLNPDKGPEYYYSFDILNSISAGDVIMSLVLTDESYNDASLTWSEKSLDAMDPVLVIYSPSSSADGSKYLYGNSITINAGATDDVHISEIRYQFIKNHGSGNSETTPWTFPSEVQNLNDDNRSVVFVEDVSAGNFDPGTHAITIRVYDSAGNYDTDTINFVVDYCRNRLDGTTVCNYEESLKAEPEPIIVDPSFSDPPYLFVWITSAIALFSIILMLVVIQTGMRGPKKKSEEEYDDDDWMSEFIGTTQDVDMDSLTDTTKSLPVEEGKKLPEIEEEEEEEEEDPFAVNIVQRKSRRTRPKKQKEVEEEEDPFFGIDDDEFEDEEEEVEEAPKPRRKVGRRTAPRNAPKRKATRRKKSDD